MGIQWEKFVKEEDKGVQEEPVIRELPLCDKCGEPVALSNDAVANDWILFRNQAPFMKDLPLAVYRLMGWCPLGFSRHLIPEGECEGSPSRAQYLEGQEPDTRGFKMRSNLLSLYRKSWQELQTLAGNEQR